MKWPWFLPPLVLNLLVFINLQVVTQSCITLLAYLVFMHVEHFKREFSGHDFGQRKINTLPCLHKTGKLKCDLLWRELNIFWPVFTPHVHRRHILLCALHCNASFDWLYFVCSWVSFGAQQTCYCRSLSEATDDALSRHSRWNVAHCDRLFHEAHWDTAQHRLTRLLSHTVRIILLSICLLIYYRIVPNMVCLHEWRRCLPKKTALGWHSNTSCQSDMHHTN